MINQEEFCAAPENVPAQPLRAPCICGKIKKKNKDLNMYYIGIDVGGMSIKGGIVDENG